MGGKQIGYADNTGVILQIRNLGDVIRIQNGAHDNHVIAARIIYNNAGVVIEDGESNSILASLIAANLSHGVALNGTTSQYDTIIDVILGDNGLDGISEKGD